MKKCILIAVAILVVSAGSALAEGPYVGANIGFGFIHESDISSGPDTATMEFDTGLALDAAAGLKLDKNLRVEGELGYLSADIDKFNGVSVGGSNDFRVLSFMANGYYDFTQLNSPVIPFVGVGLGFLNAETKVEGSDQSDTQIGYQFMLGASYPIDKNINIDLSYRLQGSFSDFKYNVSGFDLEVSYMSSSLLAGVRYNF